MTFEQLLAAKVQDFITGELEVILELPVEECSGWRAVPETHSRTRIVVSLPDGERRSLFVTVR